MKANTKLLIKQYENHQKKVRTKRLIIGTIILVPVAILVSYFYPMQEPIQTPHKSIKKENPKTISAPKIVEKVQELKKEIAPIKKEPQIDIVAKPIVKKLTLSLDTSFKGHLNEQIQKNAQKSEPKVELVPEIVEEVKIKESIEIPKTSPTISFSKERSIERLLQQYLQSANERNALQLTQYYFKKGNYKKSIEWALKCNAHNPQNSDSWFYFAKANIALGNTKDAKLALENFLLKNTSPKLQNLYKSIL
jgi:tetratricopeptide (TPR) repeat protein